MFVKKMKMDEKGAKRSNILDVKKAIANAKQYDHEDSAQYIVRMNELRAKEAELVGSLEDGGGWDHSSPC